MRRRIVVLAVGCAGLLALGGIAAAGLVKASSGSLTLASDAGDFVGQGQTAAFSSPSDTFLVNGNGNAMRVDDTIYFSSGGKGSQAILSAVDARSGTIRWQERSIEKATFVWADQKLITLDQDGNLMIAHPSPAGFKISAKAALLSHLSWTPPALVGTRVYLRDRHTLMAVDLG